METRKSMELSSRLLDTELIHPALIAERPPYLIKFAENEDEMLATQRLRYRVFNQEMGHVSDGNDKGLDLDEFDRRSVYLLVKRDGLPDPVGTYRIIGNPSGRPCDMYLSQEYRCDNIRPEQLKNVLEVGRSCVDPEYRNSSVISLLWSGLAETMLRTGARYLVGCASMDAEFPPAIWAVWDDLKDSGYFSKEFDMEPRSDYFLERSPEYEIAAYKAAHPNLRKEYPPLLKGYMSLGGNICGRPAFDRKFGTYDFLVVLDIYNMPQRFRKHFFPNGLPEGCMR